MFGVISGNNNVMLKCIVFAFQPLLVFAHVVIPHLSSSSPDEDIIHFRVSNAMIKASALQTRTSGGKDIKDVIKEVDQYGKK